MWSFFFTIIFVFIYMFIYLYKKNIMKTFIHKRLNEELTKADVKDEFNTLLKTDTFKDKVNSIIKSRIKNEPELEKFVVDITKNVLTQLYKTLWTKRSFWTSTLKNQAS